MKGQKKAELTLYLVLWTILYTLPVLSMYFEAAMLHYTSYDWVGVYRAWTLLTMFFVTFSMHNLFIAPLLVYRNRKLAYAALTLLLMAGFATYQTACRPHEPAPPKPKEEHQAPQQAHRHTMPADRHMPPNDRHKPPQAFGGQDSVALIIISLLLGLNIGTKHYFKSIDDRKRLHDLERESLNAQLAYLKYQINPHFFMNTLNNIHALVLIDPEQANEMIETLSKLMRYVLYDGNNAMAPLEKELRFAENYISLMKVRYTEKVSISVSFPHPAPDMLVPPLLFATFIENAFKHGISYEQDSFVEIGIETTKSDIRFWCNNSRPTPQQDKHAGGVGLANARRRLQLIYGDSYTLSIIPRQDQYRVTLILPARHSTEKHKSDTPNDKQKRQ